MKQLTLVLIGMWAMAGPSVASAESSNAQLTEKEAYILVDNLLDLSKTGNDKSAELQRYKRWANLHARLTQRDELSMAQMKVYLLMVFIADEKTKVHSQEEIAKEIIPMFKRQPTVMLQVLKELPFLLRPVCEQFAAHFELISTVQDKQTFLAGYEKTITDMLGKSQATACLTQIRANR